MLKRTTSAFIAIILLISLSGCVTTVRKEQEFENQGLKNQILALQKQIQDKDEELNRLMLSADKFDLNSAGTYQRGTMKRAVTEVKSRPNIKQIQICLKNAGYNPGAIDGKKGRQTRDAIKSFQKDNNISVDGKVGKQTWKLLSKHLN